MSASPEIFNKIRLYFGSADNENSLFVRPLFYSRSPSSSKAYLDSIEGSLVDQRIGMPKHKKGLPKRKASIAFLDRKLLAG